MGKRILLLEKERNLAHFLSLELQKEQYRVDQVEEGQKALSMALQTDYDLILLNAHLGDMTAQDFAEQLSRTKPARLSWSWTIEKNCKTNLKQSSVSLFHISTSQSLLMIWWLVLQQFSEVGILSTNTVVK